MADSLPTTGVEFFWPIQNPSKSNRETYPAADRQWKVVQKTATFWRHEVNKLRCRVQDANFKTFYDFLISHKGTAIDVDTPGVIPFLRNSSSNTVQILDIGVPTQTLPRHKEITVTILNTLTTPTT